MTCDLTFPAAMAPRRGLESLAERLGFDLPRQAGIVTALASGPIAAMLYVLTLCLAHGER